MPPNKLVAGNLFTDTEVIEQALEPACGPLQFRPAVRSGLRTHLKTANLSKTGLISIDSDPIDVHIPPNHGFYGLTITHGIPFDCGVGGKLRSFDRQHAHLVTPDEPFDFLARQGVKLFGTNFHVAGFEDYVRRLVDDDEGFEIPDDRRINLETPLGSSLVRYLTFVWSELERPGSVLYSELSASEIEDGLIATFAMAIRESGNGNELAERDISSRAIDLAEEYLLDNLSQPVTRDQLAQYAGVSIRSLSRGFANRHGIGPMAFLRQHRLRAAHKELLMAEHGELTVSDVALRYGYSQSSKFAAAYRTLFHESPSDTLLRH